mmetsp:Transcript_8601/g.10017  ORF Transcript_8601/g.10017 Transcript_8601/m.10017 type:complete len:243 (-) Transcript_8601:441-1169(-)
MCVAPWGDVRIASSPFESERRKSHSSNRTRAEFLARSARPMSSNIILSSLVALFLLVKERKIVGRCSTFIRTDSTALRATFDSFKRSLGILKLTCCKRVASGPLTASQRDSIIATKASVVAYVTPLPLAPKLDARGKILPSTLAALVVTTKSAAYTCSISIFSPGEKLITILSIVFSNKRVGVVDIKAAWKGFQPQERGQAAKQAHIKSWRSSSSSSSLAVVTLLLPNSTTLTRILPQYLAS